MGTTLLRESTNIDQVINKTDRKREEDLHGIDGGAVLRHQHVQPGPVGGGEVGCAKGQFIIGNPSDKCTIAK